MLRWVAAVLLLLLPLRALAVCGDGALDPGEECDDANAAAGDGCSASCLLPWAVVVAGQSNAEGRSFAFQDQQTGRVTSPDPVSGRVSRLFRPRYLFDTGAQFPTWVRANSWPCSDLDCTPKPGGTCDGRNAATHVALDPSCTCHCGGTDVDANDERASAWPTFAQRIMQDVGRETDIVFVARGSTSLVAPDGDPLADPVWSPNVSCAGRTWSSANAWIDEPGDMYCLVLHAVAQAGVSNRLKAVLWYQGEDEQIYADFHGGIPTRAQYAAALSELGDAFWSQLGIPTIVAPISLREFPGDPANSAFPGDNCYAIHDGALDAVASNPNIDRGPTTDDLEHEDANHIRDVVTLGERWASALRHSLAGLPFDGVTQLPPVACSNGADDDGDGLADAADPGCANDADLDERSPVLPCDDGADNDGDTAIDFPADPDCVSPTGASEASTGPNACGNGADDDGDGVADFPDDPGCDDLGDDSERSATLPCDNGLDDDGDGAVDFPADPECGSPTAGAEAPPPPPACANGLDDDGDGAVDAADFGCADADDDTETSAAIDCDDGLDGDGDGKIDHRANGSGDPGCADATAASRERPICQNGLDDDGDGTIDFDGGAAANGGVALAPADPQCPTPYRMRETPAVGCGLGAEIVLALALLVGRAAAPRSRRETAGRSR